MKLNPLNLKWIRLQNGKKNPLDAGWTKGRNVFQGEPTCSNWGILCGKVNNIVVIDIDSAKWKPDSCESMVDGVHPFVEKFGDFVQRFNTFTVRSASRGGHLYFKHDPDLKQTTCNHHQIDIRNGGGYIVAPGSSAYSKAIDAIGGYEIAYNSPIQPMPQDLKEWLMAEVVNKQYGKSSNVGKMTSKIIAKYKDKPTDNRIWNYNITDAHVLKIVDKLPKSYLNDYDDWLKLTTFFKILDKKHLWTQVCKRSSSYNESGNEVAWNSVDYINLNMVEHILIKADAGNGINYIKYKPTLIQNEQPTKVINRRKLGINESGEQVDFFAELGNHKFIVIKSDTGTGKTTATKKYLKNGLMTFTSIVSRRSLGMEQFRTFGEHELDCLYYEDVHYIKQGDNLITTIDSFHKCAHSIDFSSYDLFLDEFSSIIDYIIDSSTLKNKRVGLMKFLIQAMTQCKRVIMTDADISDNCFVFLKSITKDYIYVKNEFIHNKGVDAVEMTDEDQLIRRIKSLDKWILCCDTKSIADYIHAKLKDSDVKLYTSDNNEDMDMDKYDKLIYSPKIIYGLDSSMKREVFCYYKELTINPKRMIQQIARSRNITRVNYLFSKKKVQSPKYKTLDDTIKDMMETNEASIKEFGLLSGDEKLNELYVHLLSRIEFNEDAYRTNMFAHFRQLMERRGFNLIGDQYLYTKINKEDHMKTKAKLMQFKRDNFDTHSKQNKRINEYLNLPEEKMIEHMDLFLNKRELNEHFKICKFFFKSDSDILGRLKDSKDFNVKTMRSTEARIHFLNNLYKLVNDKHTDMRTRPEVITTATKVQSTSINKGFSLYFNTRLSNDFDLTTAYDCDRLINKIYSQLFRSVIVKQKGCSWVVNGKKKRGEKWIVDKKILATNKSIYDFRVVPTLQFLPIEGEESADISVVHKQISKVQKGIDTYFK